MSTPRFQVFRRTLVCIGLTTHVASAGSAPLQLERFGAREGLPAETINTLLFDHSGVMWLGTREGLYQYDGYRFTAYVHDVSDARSLVDNWVRCIAEDHEGTLWVGTNTGGLARFDRATATFTQFRHDPANPASLSHDSVYSIVDAGDNTLWVGTQSGLNRFDTRSGTAVRVAVLPAGAPYSGSEYVTAILPDPDGRLWIATVANGVLHFDPETRAVEAVPIERGTPPAARKSDAFSLAIDRLGDLWIGTRMGACVRSHLNGTLTKIVSSPQEPSGVEDVVVPAIVPDPNGGAWLGTLRGVFRVESAPAPSAWIKVGKTVAGRTSGEAITALAQSADGAVWIGTVGDALYRAAPPAGPFQTISSDPNAPRSLRHHDVTSLLEDTQGTRWIGSFGGGLSRWPADALKIESETLQLHGEEVADGVLRLAQGRPGELWIGAMDGVYRYEPGTGQLRGYLHDPSDVRTLRRGYVFALLVDRGGRLWAGTGGGGLHRLAEDQSGFERFPLRTDDPSTLSDDFITVLYQDRRHRVWVGTRSGGLNLLDTESGIARRIPVDPRNPAGFPHHYVTAILEDSRDRLWIGTGGGGLVRLLDDGDEKTLRFARVTARDGLADDNVMSLVEDDDGSLWVSTRRGLTRFDPENGTYLSFDSADGLPSSEGNLSAALRGRSALYVGTIKGLIEIPRGTPVPKAMPARLALTALRTPDGPVGGEDAAWPPRQFSIGHRDILSIEFAVVDFDPHRRHRYAYRLQDGDAPWIDLGARRELTFTDLSPGMHALQIRGRGARGGWSDPPLEIKVRVVPPFYRTTWFRLLGVLAFAGLAVTWHQVRTSNLTRRNRELTELQVQREAALAEARTKGDELETALSRLKQLTRRLEAAKEEERKRIARELHDEMGQLLTATKINVQLLQRPGADSAAPQRLTDMIALLDRMIQLVRALSFELRPPLMDELGLIPALRGHLDAQAWRTGLKVRLDASDLPARLPLEVEVAAFRIVQEALTNVVRHATATLVDVSIKPQGDRLIIDVKDDGCGFDVSKSEGVSESETHVGVRGMRERAQALGGEVRVSSTPGAGTTVRAELPGCQ